MALFGPPDVKKLEARGNVKGLIKALSYQKDWRVRRAAAEALGRLSDAGATEALSRALSDEELDVAKAAAQALGQIGGAGAVDHLSEWLDKGDWRLRAAAAEALGCAGDARAVPSLAGALKATSDAVRAAAARALGAIGDPSAAEPLIATLGDTNASVRQAAGTSLGQMGVAAIDPLLVGLAEKGSSHRRADIAGVLGRIGGTRAIDALRELLSEPSWPTRKSAAASLEALGWQPGADEEGAAFFAAREQWDGCVQIGAMAVPALIAEFCHPDGAHRVAAAHALAEIGPPAVEPLIAALGDESIGWREKGYGPGMVRFHIVRHAAALALGEIGDSRAIEPLIAALDDKDTAVRDAIASALGQIGPPAFEPLVALLRGPDRSLRSRAATALGEIGDPRAIDPLVAALHDAEWNTQASAVAALARIGPAAIEALMGILKDPSDTVRQRAAEALGKLGEPASAEALAAAHQDEDAQVRLEAARALHSMGDKRGVDHLLDEAVAGSWDAMKLVIKSEDERAVPALAAFLKDDRYRVRKAAAEELVRRYRSGKLSEAQRKRIVAVRGTITKSHYDDDHDNCAGSYPHTDSGIGVNFPL